MRRAIMVTSAVLWAAGAPAGAQAATDHGAGHGGAGKPPAVTGAHSVDIASRAFTPARVSAVLGDSVDWRNVDLTIHNVTSSAAGISTGPLRRGDRYTHRFTTAGAYPYVCTLHPFMQGRVDVHTALLGDVPSSVVAGRDVPIHGRTAADALVTIEQRPDGSPDFAPVATVRADASGVFHGSVRPQTTSTYRAIADGGASPAVRITVASELRVRVTASRGKRFTTVRVRAAGAGRATATLQFYSRERFTWVDRQRRRLGESGGAAFRLRPGLRYHARVVVSGADGVILGTSRSVKLPR